MHIATPVSTNAEAFFRRSLYISIFHRVRLYG